MDLILANIVRKSEIYLLISYIIVDLPTNLPLFGLVLGIRPRFIDNMVDGIAYILGYSIVIQPLKGLGFGYIVGNTAPLGPLSSYIRLKSEYFNPFKGNWR